MATKKNPADRDPRWTSKLKPAPGDLRMVQAFLNTAGPAHEDFTNPQRLGHWLELWGMVAPGTELAGSDLERALEVREALRTLLATHLGKVSPPLGSPRGDKAASDAAAARLDRAMASATIRLRFGAGGRARLEPASDGLDGALARLCGLATTAQFEDTWPRLKICIGEHCRAVFFDFSRNHAGKWCSSRCGSRSTSSVYRRRHLRSVRENDRNYTWRRRTFS